MKLVRNRIPEVIEKSGRKAITHAANEKEYMEGLRSKLKEEVGEFLESGDAEELADIIEVVYALSELAGMPAKELERMRKRKAKERGGFDKKIILDDVK
jgi:predicted house-cleaning noncanonical NTP pyrophosphatase (MazG superfamily)